MSDISNGEDKVSGRLVQALQTDTAVVTYRAVVGILVTVCVSLVAIIGNNLQDGQQRLERMFQQAMPQVTANTIRIQDLGERMTRQEGSVSGMDRRVTVIETRQDMRGR